MLHTFHYKAQSLSCFHDAKVVLLTIENYHHLKLCKLLSNTFARLLRVINGVLLTGHSVFLGIMLCVIFIFTIFACVTFSTNNDACSDADAVAAFTGSSGCATWRYATRTAVCLVRRGRSCSDRSMAWN